MYAHIDTADCGQNKTDHQSGVDERLHNAQWHILSFKQGGNPLPVQDLVNNHEHRHGDACPLVARFAHHLIRHE